MSTYQRRFNARPPSSHSATATTATTTGSTPYRTPPPVGVERYRTYAQERASTMVMAGAMKAVPPTARPTHPARRLLNTMASWVELGPGSTLTAPNRSRNSSSSIQSRRRTVSSRSIATWTAGPPNATVPNLAITATTSPRRLGRLGSVTGASAGGRLEQLDEVAGGILHED